MACLQLTFVPESPKDACILSHERFPYRSIGYAHDFCEQGAIGEASPISKAGIASVPKVS